MLASAVAFFVLPNRMSFSELEALHMLLAMAWSFFGNFFILLPMLAFVTWITCFPFVMFIRRCFIESPPEENSRVKPAKKYIIDSVWKTSFQDNESHEYINPNDSSRHIHILKGDTKCSICLNWYELDCELRILPCMHHFHQQCVDEWFRITATCPLCVRPIASSSVNRVSLPTFPVSASSFQTDLSV